jgi:predicted dienelactone hydrolase
VQGRSLKFSRENGNARPIVLLLLVALFLVVLYFAHHRRVLRATTRAITSEPRENSRDTTSSLPTDDGSSAPPAACETTAVGYRVLTVHGRPVALWYPTTAQPAPYSYSSRFSSTLASNASPALVCGKKVPLVVFSHGDLGCGLQSVAITEELARHGYVVAAPDHADASLCHTVEPERGPHRPPPQTSVFKPDIWDDTTFIDRRNDLEAVIAGLLSNHEFQQVIDAQAIGAAGHSLGGYTVVGLAGGWSSWLDPRIRAVVALSPYVMPFQVKKTLGNVHVPLMYQGGTLDLGITPFLEGPNGAFAAANPPVYFAVLPHAAHLAWVNCGDDPSTPTCLTNNINMRLSADYAIAFFNRYLKNIPEAMLEKSNRNLAEYKFRLNSN